MHGVDRFDDPREHALRRPAHRDHDAELRRPGRPRGAGGVEHLVELEERVDVDVGRVAARLRAERAVLRACARLGVDQALELDLGAAVREAHAVGERDEIGKLVEGDGRDREHLVARERAAFVEQRSFGDREGLVHGREL